MMWWKFTHLRWFCTIFQFLSHFLEYSHYFWGKELMDFIFVCQSPHLIQIWIFFFGHSWTFFQAITLLISVMSWKKERISVLHLALILHREVQSLILRASYGNADRVPTYQISCFGVHFKQNTISPPPPIPSKWRAF